MAKQNNPIPPRTNPIPPRPTPSSPSPGKGSGDGLSKGVTAPPTRPPKR